MNESPETQPKPEAGLPLGAALGSPWRPGNRPPSLALTVIGVVQNKPVLVWYHTRTRCWHDNPAAFGSVPVEWWQYLPDCEMLKANDPSSATPVQRL